MKFSDIYDFYMAVAIGFDKHHSKIIYGYTNYELPIKSEEIEVSQNLYIEGLDSGYNLIEQSYSDTVINYYRINYAYVLNGVNEDLIKIGSMARINPKRRVAEHAVYSVPVIFDAYILSLSSPSDEEIELFINDVPVHSFIGNYKYKIPYKIGGGNDILLKSDNDVTAMMELLLVEVN